MFRIAVVVTSMLFVLCSYASADEDSPLQNGALLCLDEPESLSVDRYLRAVSLDLLGELPSTEALSQVEGLERDAELPGGLVDTLLQDDKLIEQIVRHHRKLLWPNITNVSLFNGGTTLGGGIRWLRQRSGTYRPGSITRVTCFDEPASFDADGKLLTRPDENGIEREGWVEVNPYWAPDETIRVCGFEAQTNRFAANGADCARAAGRSQQDCGCGPNLRWCATGAVSQAVLRGFGRSIELTVDHVLRERDAYLELFETRTSFVNGPMVHFIKHLSGVTNVKMLPSPYDVDSLPDIPYNDLSWHQIELPRAHAGVLTHPAFLLRFQTNRARASRFYQSFLCAPFVPPQGGLPAASEESALDPDLQRRAGCKYCHSILEPSAAYWGRWAEVGGAFLTVEDYPAIHPECLECATSGRRCSGFCRTHYLTESYSDADAPFLGMLNAYAYRRDPHMHHVEEGPKLLGRTAVADNRFPVCVARKTAEWLLGRGTDVDDQKWLDGLALDFVRDRYGYRNLIRAIITSPQYRRVQ